MRRKTFKSFESSELQFQIEKTICADISNVFLERKKHIVSLPHELDFKESQIPSKARPIGIGPKHLRNS